MKIEEICAENNIREAQVESNRFYCSSRSQGRRHCYCKGISRTIEDKDVAIVRSYINKKEKLKKIFWNDYKKSARSNS